MKKRFPKITEAMVRKLATAKVFERGKDYYRDGALCETTRDGMQVRGQCQGSDPEPYDVRVTFNKNGVADTDCDCPYDYEGVCKHIVALLLAYVHEPHIFSSASALTSSLTDRSKEELIALINELTEKDPKLKAIVEINSATHRAKQGNSIDTSAIRKQARRVMQLKEWDYRSARSIAKELLSLGKIGEDLQKAGDFPNAGAIYHALLDEAVKAYDDMMWRGGRKWRYRRRC